MRHALLMIVLLGAACATGDRGDGSVSLGREFAMRPDETTLVAGTPLSLRFADVVADSRCPSDVTCVWAGDASIRLEPFLDGRAVPPVELHTERGAERRVRTEGFEIELVALRPWPRSDLQPREQDYEATLVVTRVPE